MVTATLGKHGEFAKLIKMRLIRCRYEFKDEFMFHHLSWSEGVYDCLNVIPVTTNVLKNLPPFVHERPKDDSEYTDPITGVTYKLHCVDIDGTPRGSYFLMDHPIASELALRETKLTDLITFCRMGLVTMDLTVPFIDNTDHELAAQWCRRQTKALANAKYYSQLCGKFLNYLEFNDTIRNVRLMDDVYNTAGDFDLPFVDGYGVILPLQSSILLDVVKTDFSIQVGDRRTNCLTYKQLSWVDESDISAGIRVSSPPEHTKIRTVTQSHERMFYDLTRDLLQSYFDLSENKHKFISLRFIKPSRGEGANEKFMRDKTFVGLMHLSKEGDIYHISPMVARKEGDLILPVCTDNGREFYAMVPVELDITDCEFILSDFYRNALWDVTLIHTDFFGGGYACRGVGVSEYHRMFNEQDVEKGNIVLKEGHPCSDQVYKSQSK